jgi:aminoglycoside phosphotransferase (APT) family kinase protein
VHPDFQPGNIGICPSGTVVFFDWGAATFSHPFISLGQFMSCTGLGVADVGAYLRHWTRYADLDELAALATVAPVLKRLDEVIEYAYVYQRVDPLSVMGLFLSADLAAFGRQLLDGALIP